MAIEVTLPDGWREVTLEQWMTLGSIKESGTEGAIKRISVLSGLPVSDVMKLNVASIEAIASNLAWTTQEIVEDFKETIEIEGKRYVLQTDVSKLEVGCFIDIESLIEDGAEDNLHLIMSCLYRDEQDQSYKGINEELADKILKLPITVVQGTSRFFFLLAESCSRITETSLRIRERMMS